MELELEDMERRYAMGNLKEASYEKFSQELREQKLLPLEAERQRLGAELSNLPKYVALALAIAAQLPVLWEKADLSTRHQLQKMVYPNGVAYAPEKGLYRTGRPNVVFDLITRKPMTKQNKKNGLCPSPGAQTTWVGPTGIEPVTC
ncbi:hypothetical protein E5K00_08460 [Hymenobacter aquaticus]|uniref:Uncharacterized protein n=1 Tax=Hymenobacter aquaticus TaxID=1867101 RepID=A0A4Z0Q7R9_9BACT|nr:hypothetical protein [Hymenobacter aquaticus]TGE25213.1 hypothetical protein E5K00_08460 [Hymenobacter aquaticus]